MEDQIKQTIDIIDATSTIKILSKPLRCSDFKKAATVAIDPECFDWCFRTLSTFINELNDFMLDPKNGCRLQTNIKKEAYYFFKIISIDDKTKYILINVKNGISVRASKELLKSWNTEACKQSWIQKSLFLELTTGSKALLKESPLLYYPITDFNSLFQSFASSFVHLKVDANNYDTQQIYDFIENFKSERIHDQVNFEKFKRINQGYLYINFIENNNTKKARHN